MADLETAINQIAGNKEMKNSSFLITGATGTIGSFLIDLLIHNNRINHTEIKIYAVGRSIDRLSKRFDPVKTERLVYVEYDFQHPFEIELKADYIIHAAGNAYPGAFNSDPVGTIIGNIVSTFYMLEYGKRCKSKRFLYISSGEIYGQGSLSIKDFSENYSGYIDSASVRSCYPLSKRAAENLCVAYRKQYGLDTVIVRPSHTYGPTMTEKDNRANVQFVRNVLEGKDIILKSDGKQLRSYCYIVDCASAVLTVLLHGKSGEAYNCANPEAQATIAGLAELIAKISGRRVVFEEPEKNEIANQTPISKQILNCKKIESLGWKGLFPLERGIEHMLKILSGE
jgi:nucleoside-diphosphate-sugar epimerase